MTIAKLIEMLREYPEDTIVRAFDAEEDALFPVTGAVYSETRGCIDLNCDEP